MRYSRDAATLSLLNVIYILLKYILSVVLTSSYTYRYYIFAIQIHVFIIKLGAGLEVKIFQEYPIDYELYGCTKVVILSLLSVYLNIFVFKCVNISINIINSKMCNKCISEF